jgi:S1-C subfamily serine protease
MIPRESIVRILAIDEGNNIHSFLGTGTFVGPRPLLVTAEHVVRDWPGPLAIAVLPDVEFIIRANLIAKDRSVDLALLEVPGYPADRSVALGDIDAIAFNLQVVSFEYGTTRQIGKGIHLAPATRVGNVTRTIDLTAELGKAGEDALELSFPALRGASGAPVISNHSFQLWGIIVANAEYHLLPAQIESVLDSNSHTVEERRYFLPQAVAVNVKHLREMLERFG